MAELLTAAQMRAIEAAAIATGQVTGLELMERAGAGVVAALCAEWPEFATAPHRAVVLAGPGNNGGDGFVIARLLQERGWAVRVALLGDPDRLPPDARTNCDRWCAIGACAPLTEASLGTLQTRPDLVVDALFGTGLTREIEGDAAFLLENLATLRADFGVRCVAVDIASGLCSDSGKALGTAPQVDLTVSFHAEKLGHCLDHADDHSARVVVADIGLPQPEPARAGTDTVWKIEPPAPALLRKPASGHKYTQGHPLILTGGAGHTGAARLAARAALRVGAGLVTLGVPPKAMPEVAAQITALMMTAVADAEALKELLWDTRLNVLCLGPGLGQGAAPRALVETALSLRRPLVLDADGLTLFRSAPDGLFALLHEACVITPHEGEFARLFPDLAAKLAAPAVRGPAYSKVDAARAAARRAGCVVLFKGAATVIAAPDGTCALHAALYDRAAPWLATAGAGDVLAGLIAGLMARGLAPMLAAETATWLHVECARLYGPGLIAEDIPECLPQVFRTLGL